MKKVQTKDFDHIAEYVHSEVKRRKEKRKHLEHVMKQIDRQIAMQPDTSHKMVIGANGLPTTARDPKKAWLPEIELPLQAEALETLTSDARAMLFPDAGEWFAAHAALTDEYLNRADMSSLLAGDENEVPTKIDQDTADKLVVNLLSHYHNQYDFRGNVDVINAESFSYGCGVGRARTVQKEIVTDTGRGLSSKRKRIPVLIPKSLKSTYLDDREHIIMSEGHAVGPLTIFERDWQLSDLKENARVGGADPDSDHGGWIMREINKLEPDKNGLIKTYEAEGDFIIPRRTTGSIVLPGTLVTVAAGKNDAKVVRLRFKKYLPNSVIAFPYHKERVGSPYATSPLMKGWPMQAAATEFLMRAAESAALRNAPPVGYDRNDMWFVQNGGPIIEPNAQWGTIGDVKVHDNFGDPTAMMNLYTVISLQYADVVGMHRARLGAETLSHTTAYAKNVEVQRGAVRTVDYVRSTLQGPLTQWLNLEYEMAMGEFKGSETFPIQPRMGYVEAEKKHFADIVTFDAHGSGEPQEELLRRQEKLEALREAIQMDQMNIQMGGQPILNLKEMIEERLHEGHWNNLDKLMNQEEAPTAQSPEQMQEMM